MATPAPFPTTLPIVAPFWDDVDLTRTGQVNYINITSGAAGNTANVITQVNDFLSTNRGMTFNADWILAVQWENVCHVKDDLCTANNVSYLSNSLNS